MDGYFSLNHYYGFTTKCAEYGITDPELVDAMYKMARPAVPVVPVMGRDKGKIVGYGPVGDLPEGGTRYTPLPPKPRPKPKSKPKPVPAPAPSYTPGSASTHTNSNSKTIIMPYSAANTTSSR